MDHSRPIMYILKNKIREIMLKTEKPIVALLFNGRPLSINYVNENVPAVLECWYLGQETGGAVADVLFGDFNPSAKLPISFPRSVGHIPAYYNHKPNDRRGYLFDDISPLFVFGFGLSYTTFEYSNIKLEETEINVNDSTSITIQVKNSGNHAGHEIVQMYIRDCVSSVTRPLKELKGFQKIYLQPDEIQTVTFEISPETLSFWDAEMNFVIEPGEFEIMIGSSSRDIDLQKLILNVT